MHSQDRMTTISVESAITDTPRVAQLQGMFDLQPAKLSSHTWHVEMPLSQRPWQIGLIVGPSGSGKSTVARNLWPTEFSKQYHWPDQECIVDAFPSTMPIKDIVALLSAVGFSSPPSWLKPYAVLSTGQQFRASLARALAEADAANPIVVIDEFTSVVDRTVAQIGSAAAARAIRQRNLQFIAVTCHHDVIPWLNPDWIYQPAEQSFAWRSLQRRPAITLDIRRCTTSAWPTFAQHHYLATNICHAAVCLLASINGSPAAFSAWLPFRSPGPKTRREHRTVCLPDYQGVGIGNALSDFAASLWSALGEKVISTTTHPAMIASRNRSPNWQMTRRPGFTCREANMKHATTRLTAGFKYIGPPAPLILAKTLLGK